MFLSRRVQRVWVLIDTFNGLVEIQGRVTKRAHTTMAYPIHLMLVRVSVETRVRNVNGTKQLCIGQYDKIFEEYCFLPIL